MQYSTDKTIKYPPTGFKVFQTSEGYYGIKYSFLGCSGTVLIVFLLTWITIWTSFCIAGTCKALFEKNYIDYSMLIFMLPFWVGEIIVLTFILCIRPFTKITFCPDYLLVSKSFCFVKTEKIFPKASIQRINQLHEKEDFYKLILEAENPIELLSGRFTGECKWLAEILSEWSGKKYVRDMPLLEKMDRKISPKDFNLETNIDGETVIKNNSYGTTAIKVFMLLVLAFWTSFCILDYSGSFRAEGDVFRYMLWIGMAFLVLVCVKIFTSSALIRLGHDSLFVKETVLGIASQKEIPKSSIKFLEQVKDGGGDEDSFPSWGLFVHWDKRTKIISRQKYENSRWLGTVISEWANVEYKACEERIYDQI